MQFLLKKSYIFIAVTMSLLVIFAIPNISYAAESAKDAVCETIGGNSTGGDCKDGDQNLGGTSIQNLLETALNILSLIAGVASVIMIILSGIKYITSAGDSSSVNSAKNTMLYAIIGLVIVLFSQVIVRFVLTEASPKQETSTVQQSNWV